QGALVLCEGNWPARTANSVSSVARRSSSSVIIMVKISPCPSDIPLAKGDKRKKGHRCRN
ncbi:MAG: hypothetical protein Q8O92_09315, partial [Candidatus Latescibacter sp.]|nr:hypothetical protein [Candidatus Latescibacter sp.]